MKGRKRERKKRKEKRKKKEESVGELLLKLFRTQNL